MAAPRGIQNIPIRIPEKWDRVWFEGFIRDVLAFADVRNAIPGAGVLIDGSSSGNATISADADVSDLFDVGYILADPSGLLPNSRGLVGEPGVVQILDPGPGTDVSVNLVAHGVALSKLQTLGQFSVVGNPTGASGTATEISAASDGMMLVRQSGQLQFVPISQGGGASAAGIALMYETDNEPGEQGPPGPRGATGGGGGGGSSPLTTKGDVWGYDSADNRIPVGANGTVLTADSTAALGVAWTAPTGGGAGASFSGVRLTRSTTQAMSGGIDTMSWDTEAYDTAAYHDNVTNPTRITIPTTGKYHITASVGYSNSGFSDIEIRLNGTTTIAINGISLSLGGGARYQLATDYAFTAGDYIEMQVIQTGGGTTVNTAGATFFAVHQLAGVAGSGALVFVGTATLVANATSLTISGLDLDTDGEYLIRFEALNVNAAQQDVSMYYNADVTAGNYDGQLGVADNTFVGAARFNSANIGSIPGGAGTAIGDWEIRIRRSVDGRVRALWNLGRGGGPSVSVSFEYGAHCWRTASTNVTSITFTIATATQLQTGTYVKVWKQVG